MPKTGKHFFGGFLACGATGAGENLLDLLACSRHGILNFSSYFRHCGERMKRQEEVGNSRGSQKICERFLFRNFFLHFVLGLSAKKREIVRRLFYLWQRSVFGNLKMCSVQLLMFDVGRLKGWCIKEIPFEFGFGTKMVETRSFNDRRADSWHLHGEILLVVHLKMNLLVSLGKIRKFWGN